MLKNDHGTRQLTTFLLQQFRTTHGEYSNCGEQLLQPVGSTGVERQDAAAGPARKVEEQLSVSTRHPMGCVVKDEEGSVARLGVETLSGAERHGLW